MCIPCSFLLFTPSRIFSITRSGPTERGSSVITKPVLLGATDSMLTLARILKEPLPDSYASLIPSPTKITPPLGRSGPGISSMICSKEDFGFCSNSCRASITSPRLWGGMLVAIPTAMPLAPFTSRFGNAAGSTSGSLS